MDYSLPGFSVHEIFQARVLEWGATAFHCLLQGISLTQGLNPGFPHCRQMLYPLSHQGTPEGSVYTVCDPNTAQEMPLDCWLWRTGESVFLGLTGL